MAGRLIGLVVVVALLAACSEPEGVILDRWVLTVGDAPGTEVTLPSRLSDLVGRAGEFTLSTMASVPPDGPLTLTFEKLNATATLAVDGQLALDLESHDTSAYRAPPWHAWQVVRPAGAGRVHLTLRVSNSWSQAANIMSAPRLSATVGGDAAYRSISSFNRSSHAVVLSAYAAMLLAYGLGFFLSSRRPADGWFIVMILAVIVMLLNSRGWSPLLFGRSDRAAMAAAIVAVGLSGNQHVHAHFRLGPLPAWMRWLWLAVPLVFLLALDLWVGWRVAFGLAQGLFLVTIGYTMARLRRLLGAPESRVDALLLMAAWIWTVGFSVPGMLSVAGVLRQSPYFIITIAFAGFAAFQITALTRDREKAFRREAAANVELRHQVSARSRELAAALATLGSVRQGAGVGSVLDGRYRLIHELGAGAMGRVFEAERTSDGRRCAVKVLRGGAGRDHWTRLALEAHRACKVTHANVVVVHDVGVDSLAGVFLVMELVRGRPLEANRERFGDLGWARPVLVQLAAGLEAIHACGIVHRDLKPANILLDDTSPSTLRIADFGLAGLTTADETALAETAVDGGLTRTGIVVGTPFYLAPELVNGTHAPQPAADVFAFGVIAYELLVGRRPFGQQAPHVCAGSPPEIARDDVPAELVVLLNACLAAEPAARPTSAQLSRALSSRL